MASIINATTSTGLVSSADNSGSLQLATNNGTTAVTINTSQNMGVGITSPTARLHVYGGSNNQLKVESSGAEANFTLAGTSYGQINNSVGDWYLTNDASANMIFRTASTERMRINSVGQVLIAKTADAFGTVGINLNQVGQGLFTFNANDSGGAGVYINRLNVDGTAMLFYKNTNPVGNIAVTGSATSYNSGSDYRLKNDIQPITNALQKVALLKPSKWTWKADNTYGDGFVAHELAEVCPHAVTGEKDAMETYKDNDGNEQTRISPQSVDTSFLVATLTAAIQELKAELDATKAEVAALKGAQ